MTSSKPVRLLTPDEAAQFLSVSQRAVKRLVADGCLRSHLPPRALESSMGAGYGPCVRALAASHEKSLAATACA